MLGKTKMWTIKLKPYRKEWPSLKFQIEAKDVKLREIIECAVEVCKEKGGLYAELQHFLSRLIDTEDPISSHSLCHREFSEYLYTGGATHGINEKYLYTIIKEINDF